MVKELPSDSRSPDTWGMWRDSSKIAEHWWLLVMLEGEPFQKTCAQPNLGAGPLQRVVRLSPILLMSFAS